MASVFEAVYQVMDADGSEHVLRQEVLVRRTSLEECKEALRQMLTDHSVRISLRRGVSMLGGFDDPQEALVRCRPGDLLRLPYRGGMDDHVVRGIIIVEQKLDDYTADNGQLADIL